MKLTDLREGQATPLTLYHLTDDAKFNPDPSYSPEDNAISYTDRSQLQGIYLAKSVETWVNGHNYWRPFVAVITADPSVVELDRAGRWGGEIFVAGEHFDLIKVNRVIPLDAWAREEYGMHGWLEEARGIAFDTGEPITTKYWETPFKGYTYPHDLRSASETDIAKLKKHFDAGMHAKGH